MAVNLAVDIFTAMITIKRKIIVAIEKRKRKGILITENAPIFLRLTYSGNRINLYSGFRVDLKQWDVENRVVKKGVINSNGYSAEIINHNIDKYQSELHSFFLKCQVEEIIPTREDVKGAFESIRFKGHPKEEVKPTPQKSLSFFDVFDEFTEYTGRINNWTDDTYTKFKTLRMHLHNYKGDLKFEELNDEGLSDLLAYFMNKLKMRNTTTKKYFEFISWFLRYALSKNHTDNDAFLHFKPKLKRTKKKIIFFTEEEINKIKNTTIPVKKQYLERVRDVLLFLCYSGLRHSDVYKLKKSDIKNSKFEVTTKKTNDSLTIALNDTTKSILKKYKDIPLRNNKALPVISNQKMNEYLKDLAELAEIDEPITETYFIGNRRYDDTKPKHELVTTHIGRRTFICLCISKGIHIQTIMKWTGHSDYKAMLPYIEVSEKTKEKEMNKLNF